jgi:hypothetical protein
MSEAKPFETTCPKCGTAKVEGERNCPNCGYDLYAIEPDTKGSQNKASSPPRHRKSIGLTILLAIIFPGLGHLYAGRWTKGLTIMVGFIILLLVVIGIAALLGASVVGILCLPLVIIGGLLLFIPFELWQITDAIASSAAINAGRA